MPLCTKTELEHYKIQIKDILSNRNFKSFIWETDELVFYRFRNNRLVIVYCTDDSTFVVSPVNIYIIDDVDEDMVSPIECVENIIMSDTPFVGTNHLGWFHAMAQYNFAFRINNPSTWEKEGLI